MSEKMKKNKKQVDEKVEHREASPGVKIRRRNEVSATDESAKAEDKVEAASAVNSAEKAPNEKSIESTEVTGEAVQADSAPKKSTKKSTTKEATTDDAHHEEKKSGQEGKTNSTSSSESTVAAKSEKKTEADAQSGANANDESKQKSRPAKSQKKVEVSARIISPSSIAAEDVAHVEESVSAKQSEDVKGATEKADKSAKAHKDIDAKSEKNDDVSKQKKTETENNQGQKPQDADKAAPAASAVPDKEASQSILPPAGTRTTRVVHGDQEGTEPASASQVRVISRPSPDAARVVANAPPYERRPVGDGRNSPGGYRPGGYRPGGGANRPPGGGANRPAGTGANRPPPREGGGFSRDAGAARPPFDKDAPRFSRPAGTAPRVGGGMPFGGGGGAPPMDNDQSRKKRNKGRRTVEFGQSDSQDNSRRRNSSPMGMGDDDNFRHRRSRRPKKPVQAPQSTQPMKAAKRKIRFDEAIRVADIAHQMSVKASEVIKALFNLGVMATINNALDIDTATLIASEFGYEVDKVGFSEDNYLVVNEAENSQENQTPRPPVVTIMGHVDHGKTSLLDAIRKTSVTSVEAGGITQHIGAYHVKTKRGNIVFLDTPGHEAFTAMRARGAQITDLVVLVVAADDGVMEQTREAINHSKAAGVPILVAVNKMDKEGADSDRVLRELSELGLQAESWGGDTVVGHVSAKTGDGLDELLELIALQSEIMELTANQDKAARGRVVEAKLDKGRGPVATVLIQEGTLRPGDTFVCGVFAGRVRALFNDQGRKIKEAGPSIPVEIQGFDGVPEAGEEFICLTDEKTARRIADSRAIKQRERELAKKSRVTLETFLASAPTDTTAQVLNLVIKADVQGSLEAIIEALHKLSTDKVRISVIHSGVGAITETDIMLASASHGIIIGFNVRPTAKVKDVAEHEMVDIRFYDIIYKLVEEIRDAMAGMLAPISREVYLGQAEVRQTFGVPKVGVIAGSMVNDGKIIRNGGVRLLRDGVVVYTGKVGSLRRIKDDVKEVTKGFECGIGLENFNDIKIGDVLECFEIVEEAATL